MPARRRSTAPTSTLPFRETDRVDTPVSLYAATKRADELMSHAYAHLFGLPQTGLRFFTVYGPWGRPDMAYFSFARAIMAGEPITLYDDGRLKRDFTYIDDIVAGVVGCLDRPPDGRAAAAGAEHRQSPGRGGARPGAACWRRRWAARRSCAIAPRPAVDVEETFAVGRRDRGADRVSRRARRCREGIPRFVAWFRAWRAANRDVGLRKTGLTAAGGLGLHRRSTARRTTCSCLRSGCRLPFSALRRGWCSAEQARPVGPRMWAMGLFRFRSLTIA